MFVILIIAALILIGVVIIMIRKPGGSANAMQGGERFRHAGPGEPKPEKPRATGLD